MKLTIFQANYIPSFKQWVNLNISETFWPMYHLLFEKLRKLSFLLYDSSVGIVQLIGICHKTQLYLIIWVTFTVILKTWFLVKLSHYYNIKQVYYPMKIGSEVLYVMCVLNLS